ncbi:MAG: rod shape-determining protein RodA [Alphaproteobacteria bacterium]
MGNASRRLSSLAWEDGTIPSIQRAGGVFAKIWRLSFVYIGLICAVAAIGFLLLFSAADGDLNAYAVPQMKRFAVGLFIAICVALIDIRFIMKLAYPAYVGTLLLLIGVELFGRVGMGAQRWLDIGGVSLQPSELMKIAIILALARYFHSLPTREGVPIKSLIIPALLIAAPVLLVLNQPDLGTALLIALGALTVAFMAGVPLRLFVFGAAGAAAVMPFAWTQLHDYQKARVMTFLDPSRDPLGAGYHITQSKIALGSGGTWGRGLMEGTQSHLSFLPESQTDFIFTVLAEEFGLFGASGLVMIYVVMIGLGWIMAGSVKNHFGRLMAAGLNTMFFLYVLVNIAMVIGLMPVVGVPLPLVSYGGTAMLTVLLGLGLLMNAHVHRDVELSRNEGVIL